MNALKSPLLGPWTTEALIFRHNRELDEQRQSELYYRGNEVWEFTSRLFTQMPNIRIVSLCTDWFEMPLEHIVGGLTRTTALRELRLVQAGDMSQLLGAVCKKIPNMTALRHLYLQFSGYTSAYTKCVPPSELEGASPDPALEKVTLKIGNASPIALRYIHWLTKPREGENSYRLKSLKLDLSASYYTEFFCFDALTPCFSTLSNLSINVSGLGEGLLARVLRACHMLESLEVTVRHTFENSMFVELPKTLRRFRVDASNEEPNWEEGDERLSTFFKIRAPRNLRQFIFHLVCYADHPSTDTLFLKSRAIADVMGIEVIVCCAMVDGSRCICP